MKYYDIADTKLKYLCQVDAESLNVAIATSIILIMKELDKIYQYK